jgi:hypothetical protein
VSKLLFQVGRMGIENEWSSQTVNEKMRQDRQHKTQTKPNNNFFYTLYYRIPPSPPPGYTTIKSHKKEEIETKREE